MVRNRTTNTGDNAIGYCINTPTRFFEGFTALFRNCGNNNYKVIAPDFCYPTPGGCVDSNGYLEYDYWIQARFSNEACNAFPTGVSVACDIDNTCLQGYPYVGFPTRPPTTQPPTIPISPPNVTNRTNSSSIRPTPSQVRPFIVTNIVVNSVNSTHATVTFSVQSADGKSSEKITYTGLPRTSEFIETLIRSTQVVPPSPTFSMATSEVPPLLPTNEPPLLPGTAAPADGLTAWLPYALAAGATIVTPIALVIGIGYCVKKYFEFRKGAVTPELPKEHKRALPHDYEDPDEVIAKMEALRATKESEYIAMADVVPENVTYEEMKNPDAILPTSSGIISPNPMYGQIMTSL